jgi:hypothetical protein
MLCINRKSRFILATMLFLVAGIALAAQTKPTGSWSGVLRNDNNSRVHVDATFDSKMAHLHFDEPANCKVDASYIETDSDGSHYAFKPTVNGGKFCQDLYRSNLVATTSDDSLIFSITQGDVHWRGDLKPDSP